MQIMQKIQNAFFLAFIYKYINKKNYFTKMRNIVFIEIGNETKLQN